MQTFNQTTRELSLKISNGYCQCSKACTETVTEFHHKLSNTQTNQRLFPYFIQSIFNCCPINNNCHMSKPLPKVSVQEALVYETWLEDFKKNK